MILNPQAKKILCFGDSLTWGNHFSGNRFPKTERWTYILQELLGDSFDVIEEGLRSRTTNLDDPDEEYRNGFAYFCPCFQSIWDISVLVLFLGTNDVKTKFQMTPEVILKNLELYIHVVQDYNAINIEKRTKIILVSPPKINVEKLKSDSSFDTISDKKLKQLSELEESYCLENGIEYLSLYEQCHGNDLDGIHLEFSDNRVIADLLFKKIQKNNT